MVQHAPWPARFRPGAARVKAPYESGSSRGDRQHRDELAAFARRRREGAVDTGVGAQAARPRDAEGRVEGGRCYERRFGPAPRGRRRGRLAPLAHTAFPRPEQAVDGERRGELAPHAGHKGGWGSGARLLLLGRRLLARTEGPRRGRELAEGRYPDLVLR